MNQGTLWLRMVLTIGLSLLAGGKTMAANEQESIGIILDQFHQAAAEHDFQKYFDLMSADAVFIGTDATERWTKAAFKDYVKPHFDKGHGWTYIPKQRNISFAPSAQVAWFDEILDNEKYGTCRGSGVLLKEGKSWKISQYHLTIPVPNALVLPLVKMIQDQSKKPSKG